MLRQSQTTGRRRRRGRGWVVDIWGWDGGFIFFTAAAILAAIAFALTWKERAA